MVRLLLRAVVGLIIDCGEAVTEGSFICVCAGCGLVEAHDDHDIIMF